MTEQLDMWEGDFGNTYTKRNPVDWITRVISFGSIVRDLGLGSILEVGCNRGHNLLALAKVTDDACQIVGIEPNAFALEISRSYRVKTMKGNAYNLPFSDNRFDMVMTVAVLSHIHADHLTLALREIYRVSRKYLLAIEYYWYRDKEIAYTGKGLWRRNYLKIYLDTFPTLKVVKYGDLDKKDGFDDLTYWLLQKDE